MIQIIVPLAAIKAFSKDVDYAFPLPLIDVKGKVLIQYVLENLGSLNEEKQFIFIINESDSNKYHIDNTLRQLVDNSTFIYLKEKTKGSVCSVLMAVDEIVPDLECIIVNSDQFIDFDYDNVVKKFRDDDVDGGVITFNSLHPRWSYVRVENEYVVETAEKNPISNNAIAGFYYFKKSQFFIDAAFKTILNDVNYQNKYYTSSVYNQMILDGKKVKNFPITTDRYHSFYSPEKIKDFEIFLKT